MSKSTKNRSSEFWPVARRIQLTDLRTRLGSYLGSGVSNVTGLTRAELRGWCSYPPEDCNYRIYELTGQEETAPAAV